MGRGIEFYSIAKAFSEIGLSFQTVFPDVDIAIELYKNHNWYVLKKNNFTIIHAVPLVHLLDSSFWEQWSATTSEPAKHQVLYRKTPPVPHHGIYEAKEEFSEINPTEVSGSIWYIIHADNPRGWALNIL